MNPLVETVWRPLVQRRLLPVAIVLIAALAAIPFLLAKDPEPAPVAPAPVAGGDASLTATAADTESIVSLVGDGERTKRRRVLGARKNPFEPAPAPKAPKPPKAATPAQLQGPSTGGSGSSGGSGVSGPVDLPSTPPSSTAPVAPPPATGGEPAPPKRKHELYSLTVRFGDSSADVLEKMNLARLKPLPSATDPILVYLGVGKDGKSAVFMVDAAVEPQGDGTCRPSPASCETIHLREGETEFFDVKDEAGEVVAQYQLDLLKIERRTTASAAKAKRSRARASKAGRKLLRARVAESGPLPFRYDARKGFVARLELGTVSRTALAATGGF